MQTKRKLWPLRLSVILAIGIGVLGMLAGRRPDNLGVRAGKLAACPDKPNCVSTQATDEEHAIAPLEFSIEASAMKEAVRRAFEEWPRTNIVTESDDYIHAECRSLVCRFVDDVEVWVDHENNRLHARSASRVGYSDLGVNRDRIEALFEQLR